MRGRNIKVYDSLGSIPDGIICVVDTPPSLSGSIPAIQQADVIIVPIILGKDAAAGLERVRQVRGINDLRIVANDWDDSSNQKEVEEHLIASGYKIIYKLPKYKRITYNLDHDLEWHFGLTEPIINYILTLVKILIAKPTG